MKINNLPVFDIDIEETKEESGTNKISFVNRPATQEDLMYFSDQNESICFADDERRLVTAPVMVPNKPIYRNQGGKEFYVNFSVEVIEKMRDKFMKEHKLSEVNTHHKYDVEGVTIVETFITDSSRGMKEPEGANLGDGVWWATFRVDNDEVWQGVKDGTFKGISLEGHFDLYEKFEDQNKNSDDEREVSFKNTILSPDSSLVDKINALKGLNKKDK